MRMFERRRAPVIKKKAPKRRKGKATRVNYLVMNLVDYAKVTRKDWYTATQRDAGIEDPNFWCMEQLFIHKDIYLNFRHPIHPMLHIKMCSLSNKPSFAQAPHVIE